MVAPDDRQPHGTHEQVTVCFDLAPNSSNLVLSLQVYPESVPINLYASSQQVFHQPPIAAFNAVSVFNNSDWRGFDAPAHLPWCMSQGQGQYQIQHRLAANSQPPRNEILQWIETQITGGLDQTHHFAAKLTAFIFLLVNKALPIPLERSTTPLRRSASSNIVFSARYLLRNVCEMTCWVRLWNTETMYYRDANGIQPLPATTLRELKNLALPWLAEAERLVLESLDDLLARNGGIQDDEMLPVWACLWQLILLYRNLLQAYADKEELERFVGGESTSLVHLHHLFARLLVDQLPAGRFWLFFRNDSACVHGLCLFWILHLASLAGSLVATYS